MRLILASSSPIRRQLLTRSNVAHEAIPARVDEEAIRASLLSEGVSPRDLADALADAKAQKVSQKNPDAIVLGSDQILDFEGQVFSKAETQEDAAKQLRVLRGKKHSLHSAVVAYEAAKPVWRQLTTAHLTMRPFSDDYLKGYLERNWHSVQYCVGAYKLEEEGARLFQNIEGDYFTVLGLPLIELLGYFSLRGVIDV